MAMLIELDALIDNIDWDNDLQKWALRGEPEDIPTVDAVEVVRCRDCYHGGSCICVCCEDGEMVHCGLHHKHMNADDFCSSGWKWKKEERHGQ